MIKVLTVTGYKPTELGVFSEKDERIQFIKYAIQQRLIAFIEEGLEWVIIAGQSGIEMWTADVVFTLKETYDIQLGVFPPFENQANRWPEHLQQKYENLQMEADHFQPIYKGDYQGPFQFKAKDKWFIDKSDASLILMDQEFPGSTIYYHDMAQAADNHPIYYITPLDLDDAVEVLRMTESTEDMGDF